MTRGGGEGASGGKSPSRRPPGRRGGGHPPATDDDGDAAVAAAAADPNGGTGGGDPARPPRVPAVRILPPPPLQAPGCRGGSALLVWPGAGCVVPDVAKRSRLQSVRPHQPPLVGVKVRRVRCRKDAVEVRVEEIKKVLGGGARRCVLGGGPKDGKLGDVQAAAAVRLLGRRVRLVRAA